MFDIVTFLFKSVTCVTLIIFEFKEKQSCGKVNVTVISGKVRDAS